MILKSMNVGELLDTSINLYKEQFRSYAILGACSAVAIAGISILDVILGEHEGFSFCSVLLIYCFVGSAITKKASEQILERKLSNKEALRFAMRKFWLVLLASILYYLLVVLGFLLFIIPGFYFIILFALATEAIVIDNTGPKSALKRSKYLIENYWWHSFWTIALTILLSSILDIVMEAGILGTVGMDLTGRITKIIISLPFDCIVTPFTAIVYTLLYYDLKMRKENFDLQIAVENLTHKNNMNVPEMQNGHQSN